MPLSKLQRKQLLPRCSSLKPVVMVGAKGVTDAVVAELDVALSAHELVKVRVNAADRDERRAMTATLAEGTGSELVHAVGHVVVLYRERPAGERPLP